MKIRCDFCGNAEASLFCSADEAALCHVCDRRVHQANKLASKHNRFDLLQPTCEDSPRCDICQEKRGFLFCQEDRAILCRECDNSIHKANEHTRKHNRFVLTGVKLSADSTQYPSSSTCSTFSDVVITNSTDHSRVTSKSSTKRTRTRSNEQTSYETEENCSLSDNGSVISTNSISEYLMGDQINEWSVEDLLDVSFDFDNFYGVKTAPFI